MFPKPFMVDIISIDEEDIIIHFKSSNWTNYDVLYLTDKKEALKRLLNVE